MKKTYIIPTAKIVKIKPTRLMQASDQQIPISTTNNYNGTTIIESRQDRNTIWDDGGEE